MIRTILILSATAVSAMFFWAAVGAALAQFVCAMAGVASCTEGTATMSVIVSAIGTIATAILVGVAIEQAGD